MKQPDTVVPIETPEGTQYVMGQRVWVRTRDEFDALCAHPQCVAGYFDPATGGTLAMSCSWKDDRHAA